ncbi:uncharacterized protein LOC119363495 [Triticum dicoccoides]|uniref:uncharacterized protein LOC119363495 n=1 Tax=Triticum dicoccoides TaxID=85692 RepID=UPI00189098CD|nr:uncharacterized protein LOC119363495 [Triticum dicoccoides]
MNPCPAPASGSCRGLPDSLLRPHRSAPPTSPRHHVERNCAVYAPRLLGVALRQCSVSGGVGILSAGFHTLQASSCTKTDGPFIKSSISHYHKQEPVARTHGGGRLRLPSRPATASFLFSAAGEESLVGVPKPWSTIVKCRRRKP